MSEWHLANPKGWQIVAGGLSPRNPRNPPQNKNPIHREAVAESAFLMIDFRFLIVTTHLDEGGTLQKGTFFAIEACA